MKTHIFTFGTLVFCLLSSLPGQAQSSAAAPTYDLVIYGGTSAALAAAVQAKRMGKSVIILCPETHLGGLTSGGLGWTDSGNKDAIGGISREFYQAVKKHYDQPAAWRQQKPEDYSRYRPQEDAMWVFEPHVAEAIYESWIEQYEIPVERDAWLDREKGVKVENNRITEVTMLDGRRARGRMFMDAGYEGDLLAAAGVSYTVGREANSVYDETLNGVQTRRAVKHQFIKPVSAYRVPGDPSSGLLPKVHGDNPGKDGEGDHRVQAYCYRLCMTDAPENRIPFPKPANYDPMQYELLGRVLDTGWRGVWQKFDPAPNRKTDTNNHGPFSMDNIGVNYDYPEADYARRREILAEHKTYQMGLLWFLANDPRVPEDVRKRTSKWGLPKDEFTETGGWSHQIYVREARRMIGDFVMTENELTARKPTPESIGLGSYNMDSHNTQRYVDADGHARNEGDIQISPGGAYPISYGSIIPKKDEIENLLVPCAVSASHIAYGSIRMEPVFMILGQSGATAAALSIDAKCALQDLDYDQLKQRLLADKQVLELPGGPRKPKRILNKIDLKGQVADDAQAKKIGHWQQSTSVSPYVEYGYRHDGDDEKGKQAVFYFQDLKPGSYEVRYAYTPNENRASNVPVTIRHQKASTRRVLNQKKAPAIDGLWQSLGRFSFGEKAEVQVDTTGTDGHVIIDAIQLLPVEEARPAPKRVPIRPGQSFRAPVPRKPPMPRAKEVAFQSGRHMEKAMFWAPGTTNEVPLLVVLHTWSGDFKQQAHRDAFSECVKRGWVYIHPNFQGPNRQPLACGSFQAVRDVLESVRYAQRRANVDPDRVYLLGTSGGGHMALLMAGREPSVWAGVSAWVPITDLAAWHTQRAPDKYSRDLEACCGGAPGTRQRVDEEYTRRSPLTWLARARGLAIDINAGIHDGHRGSVPVSHSLRAFNVLADVPDQLTEEQITFCVEQQAIPDRIKTYEPDPLYKLKRVLFRRHSGGARITLFKGGHESIQPAAVQWLSKQRRARAEQNEAK